MGCIDRSPYIDPKLIGLEVPLYPATPGDYLDKHLWKVELLQALYGGVPAAPPAASIQHRITQLGAHRSI